MSDYDALLAAICADPGEDTLRLAFADWLEEHDQPERAAFVREQIALARTLEWEPFAVACRWRYPERMTGKSFRDTLPPLDGFHLEWHDEAFRRGLGWRLNVRSVGLWPDAAPEVLSLAPIGEMRLWNATLDDWIRFAQSPVIRQLQKLHFVNSPIEPLRVLRDRPEALGLTDLYFERSGGAGMPVVIEDLLQSPLGSVVRGLHFHVGYESLEDLIDALHTRPTLERLSFSVMGMTSDLIRRLSDGPTMAGLSELSFSDEPFGNEGLRVLAGALPASLHTLRMAQAGGHADGLEALTRSENLRSLRRLDLSRNPLSPRAARVLSASWPLAGLRSLDLHGCRIGDKGLRRITRAKFWPNLVELDLRDNPVSLMGVRYLLDAEVPRDLAALVLSGGDFGGQSRAELRHKYGERVVFTAQ